MNRLLGYFKFEHLPPGPMQETSRECAALAHSIDGYLEEGAEKTAGLRKLLEAKDCFVRAAIGKVDGE